MHTDRSAFGDEVIPRQVPRHAEAYPRLDLRFAERVIMDGRTICVFEREHRGRVGHFEFGHYERDDADEQTIHGLFETFPDYNLLGSKKEVAFRIRKSNNGHEYALCPRCREPKAKLVFVRDWKCRQCHGLLLRSQLINPSARWNERASAIEDRLRRGRPKGMHNTTYVELRKEAKALRAICGPRMKMNNFIAVEHNRVVKARWITPAQDLGWDWEERPRGFGE